MTSELMNRYLTYVDSAYKAIIKKHNLQSYIDPDPIYKDDWMMVGKELRRHYLELLQAAGSSEEVKPKFLSALFATAMHGAFTSRTFYLLDGGSANSEEMRLCTRAGFLFTISFNVMDHMIDDLNDPHVIDRGLALVNSQREEFGPGFFDQLLRGLLSELIPMVKDDQFFEQFKRTFSELMDYFQTSSRLTIAQATSLNIESRFMARNSTKYISMLYVISRVFSRRKENLDTVLKTFEDTWRIFSLMDDMLDIESDTKSSVINYLDCLLISEEKNGSRERFAKALSEGNVAEMLEIILDRAPFVAMLNEHLDWYKEGIAKCWGRLPKNDPQVRWLLREILLETTKLKTEFPDFRASQ